jgi:hypothetical protein
MNEWTIDPLSLHRRARLFLFFFFLQLFPGSWNLVDFASDKNAQRF